MLKIVFGRQGKIILAIFVLSIFFLWRSLTYWSEWTKIPSDLEPRMSQEMQTKVNTLEEFHDEVMDIYRMVRDATGVRVQEP